MTTGRTRTQYAQDYAPRFAIGARVIIAQGLSDERETEVTARLVYRDKTHSAGDTFYTFADGSGAWEWNVSHATERVAPEVAMGRIVASFGARLAYSALDVVRTRSGAHEVHVHIEATHAPALRADGATVTRVDYWTTADDARTVETIGEWRYRIDGAEHTAENLGDAIVTTYNATLGQ